MTLANHHHQCNYMFQFHHIHHKHFQNLSQNHPHIKIFHVLISWRFPLYCRFGHEPNLIQLNCIWCLIYFIVDIFSSCIHLMQLARHQWVSQFFFHFRTTEMLIETKLNHWTINWNSLYHLSVTYHFCARRFVNWP